MISRPIVAAPLVAWLLGDVSVGLQVGLMVELLWQARLPVGAAVPPDDTQVAVGATVLTLGTGPVLAQNGLAFTLLCLMIAIPFGKFGQFFDRMARLYHGRKVSLSTKLLEKEQYRAMENLHLRGLLSFGVASLATYLVIVSGGLVLVPTLAFTLPAFEESGQWLRLILPLVGIATILGTINVNRSLTLFGASFGMAFLLMWLV
jgi:PTS system mannose-specific IIC component